jgi:hypothetical protein
MEVLRGGLMPDDPADLWGRGPDIARAAALHEEIRQWRAGS